MKLINCLKYFNVGSVKLNRSSFKVIDDADIEYFRTILKPSQIITDEVDLEFYNSSWNKMEKGKSKLALTP